MDRRELLERWKKELDQSYLADSSKKQYYHNVNLFLKNAKEITEESAKEFIFEKKTAYLRCIAVKLFFERVLKKDLDVRCKQVTKELKKKVLDREEIKEIIEKIKNDEIRLLFKIQYETGSRVGSLLNLRVGDVKFRDDYAELRLIEKGGEGQVKYISKVLAEELKELIRGKKKSEYVFHITDSEYRYHYVERELKKIDEEISTHWFRHSRIRDLFERGYDMIEVQRVTQHKSLESLARYLREAGLPSKKIIEKESVF